MSPDVHETGWPVCIFRKIRNKTPFPYHAGRIGSLRYQYRATPTTSGRECSLSVWVVPAVWSLDIVWWRGR